MLRRGKRTGALLPGLVTCRLIHCCITHLSQFCDRVQRGLYDHIESIQNFRSRIQALEGKRGTSSEAGLDEERLCSLPNQSLAENASVPEARIPSGGAYATWQRKAQRTGGPAQVTLRYRRHGLSELQNRRASCRRPATLSPRSGLRSHMGESVLAHCSCPAEQDTMRTSPSMASEKPTL